MKNQTLIESYLLAWQKRDWDFVESVLAEDFTFTSPYDDRIELREYKEKCWNTIREIGEFEFVAIIENETEAFARYRNRINGEPVQNAEHFIFRDGKLKGIVVFFGRPKTSKVKN